MDSGEDHTEDQYTKDLEDQVEDLIKRNEELERELENYKKKEERNIDIKMTNIEIKTLLDSLDEYLEDK